MIFTARRIKADEALRIGLVNRLATDIEAETRSLAAEIAEGAPLSIIHAKKAIDFLTKRPGHEDDAEVAWLAARCFDSADYAEGRSAFLEKRKPLFRGA
jgi:enoyl-CoA hydratase/carnithine racemase